MCGVCWDLDLIPTWCIGVTPGPYLCKVDLDSRRKFGLYTDLRDHLLSWPRVKKLAMFVLKRGSVALFA